MKNFRLIRPGVAITPLLEALSGVDAAWDLQTGRQEKKGTTTMTAAHSRPRATAAYHRVYLVLRQRL
ncbi:MAG: hypothetical protein RIC38_15690, partial [Chromatocurvus sp.]